MGGEIWKCERGRGDFGLVAIFVTSRGEASRARNFDKLQNVPGGCFAPTKPSTTNNYLATFGRNFYNVLN